MIVLRMVRSIGVTAAAWVILTALAIWIFAGTATASAMLDAMSGFIGHGDFHGALLAVWRETVVLQGGLVGAGLLLLYQLCLLHIFVVLAEHELTA